MEKQKLTGGIKKSGHRGSRQSRDGKISVHQFVDLTYPLNKKTHHLKQYFQQGAEFHGYLSPGLALGIIMVDLAMELLGPSCNLIDAVVETKACIPDAVQLMTSCTYGNGWMRVKDWDKMAITLYDKDRLDGIRVSVNLEELKKYPLIFRWYMRCKRVDKEKVTQDIILAYRDLLAWQKVIVMPYKRHRAPFSICTLCGETYTDSDSNLCMRCGGGDNYYNEVTSSDKD